MSGHHSICTRAVGAAQEVPAQAARPACFAPALSLLSSFETAQDVVAVFAAAAAHDGQYETRRRLTATFAPVAVL
jgi:hypothetical protein